MQSTMDKGGWAVASLRNVHATDSRGAEQQAHTFRVFQAGSHILQDPGLRDCVDLHAQQRPRPSVTLSLG